MMFEINEPKEPACEFEGRLIINYSWDDQKGVEFLAEATYVGSEREFLTGWFPENAE